MGGEKEDLRAKHRACGQDCKEIYCRVDRPVCSIPNSYCWLNRFKASSKTETYRTVQTALSRRPIRYITEMQMLIQYGLVQATELCADVKGNCFDMGSAISLSD